MDSVHNGSTSGSKTQDEHFKDRSVSATIFRACIVSKTDSFTNRADYTVAAILQSSLHNHSDRNNLQSLTTKEHSDKVPNHSPSQNQKSGKRKLNT